MLSSSFSFSFLCLFVWPAAIHFLTIVQVHENAFEVWAKGKRRSKAWRRRRRRQRSGGSWSKNLNFHSIHVRRRAIVFRFKWTVCCLGLLLMWKLVNNINLVVACLSIGRNRKFIQNCKYKVTEKAFSENLPLPLKLIFWWFVIALLLCDVNSSKTISSIVSSSKV